ncbi:MAG: hypothetical protein WCG25_09825 [bacterium]
MDSLSKILHYYLRHKCFYRIKPYNNGTNAKLVAFCLKFENEFEYNIEIPLNENEISKKDKRKSDQDKRKSDQGNLISLYNAFSELKIEIFSYQFKYLASKLTPRPYKVFGKFYTNYSFHDIIEKIIFQDYRIDAIRAIGVKSVNEWEGFKKEIEDLIIILGDMNHNEMLKIYLSTFIIKNFKPKNDNIEVKFDLIIGTNEKINLFALINLFIESNFKLNEVKKYYFDYYYSHEFPEKLTLDSVGKIFGITGKRVDQMKNSLIRNLPKHFLFINDIKSKILLHNYLDTDKDFIVLDYDMVRKFNELEGVSYNLRMYGYVFSMLYWETHVLVNELKFGIIKNNLHYLYLVKASMLEIFDFIEFIKDLEVLTIVKNTKKSGIQFENYISKFIKHNTEDDLVEIIEICKTIMQTSYNITIINNNDLVFESQEKIKWKDYIYKVIEQKGCPMNLQEICQGIKEICFDREVIEGSIKSNLISDKQLFISFGKSGTYGLKKWEKSRNDIMGGTIRRIVFEFLQKEDTPMYFMDITRHVKQYRNTSDKNINTNIREGTKNIFRFFKGGYVGLTSKLYDENNLTYKRLAWTKFSHIQLKALIGQSMDDINSHFVSKYGYTKAQVNYMLTMLMNKNSITFSKDNILIRVEEAQVFIHSNPKTKKSE